MAGAYAHMMVMNAITNKKYMKDSKIPKAAKIALNDLVSFCELGALSPDYPYLSIIKPTLRNTHTEWADEIHYGMRTKLLLECAVEEVKKLKDGDRDIAFAWLAGLTSHILTDVTIHPIVNLIVGGEYKWHMKDHRRCEMHQDVYIYRKILGLDVAYAEHLKSGIMTCTKAGEDKIHPVIQKVWKNILKKTFPEQYAVSPPDINTWHSCFIICVDKIAEEAKLMPLSRHLVNEALAYPELDKINMKYIEGLPTPIADQTIHYDELFDRAVRESLSGIEKIAKAVYEKNDSEFNSFVANWNLDSGRTEGSLKFWAQKENDEK